MKVLPGSGLLTDQAIIDTAVAYMNDHKKHLEDYLNKLLTTNSFDAWSIQQMRIRIQALGSVANQTDVLNLALNVKFQAATFYFSNIVTAIKSPSARTVFANILPVENCSFYNL